MIDGGEDMMDGGIVQAEVNSNGSHRHCRCNRRVCRNATLVKFLLLCVFVVLFDRNVRAADTDYNHSLSLALDVLSAHDPEIEKNLSLRYVVQGGKKLYIISHE